MIELTQNQQKKLELLEASFGIQDVQNVNMLGITGSPGLVPNPALCASLKREEQLQYKFMAIYQVLVLILALIVLALLAFAAWRISTGEDTYQAVISGAGALISSVAARFILNQRKDAREWHTTAQAGLMKHNCPEDI